MEDPNVFAIVCDHDKVEDALREIVKFAKNTNSLVILDDYAASQAVKKQNQRTRQTCVPRETHRSEHDSHHPTTNFHREALQGEHIEARDLLQRSQGRQERRIRKPSECR